MTRTAIIAAMPGELKPLVRGWQHESHNGVDIWTRKQNANDWVAACAGAGVAAATRAFAAIEKDGAIDSAVSVGWAGALDDGLLPGRAYRVARVTDIQTGERFERREAQAGCSLLTSPKVADRAEKRRLASSYRAGLVDMEAAAIARLAESRGIPFYCIKGVSDGPADNLPDFNRFIDPNGKFRTYAFVIFALLSPWLWPALIQMGENSRKASQAIAESLLDLLDERGHIRNRNGYTNLQR
jgi:adenosylhomocysteine nucleosidase